MKRIGKKLAKEWALVILTIALLGLGSFIFATNVITPVKVDGASMEPTLEDNQYMFVNKLAYTDGEAEYGDVVVTRKSKEEDLIMVKRVYGKPNDTIEFLDNVLYRNGVVVEGIVLPADYEGTTGFGEAVKLEAGQYYLLGDNLPESSDSREMGAIDYENFIGKVLFK